MGKVQILIQDVQWLLDNLLQEHLLAKVPMRHKFCPETVVRDTVADEKDVRTMPGGGVMLRCRLTDNFKLGPTHGIVEMVPQKVQADTFNLKNAVENAEHLRAIKRGAGEKYQLPGIIPGKTPQGHCQVRCSFAQYC